MDILVYQLHDLPALIKTDVKGERLCALTGISKLTKACSPQAPVSVHHKTLEFLQILSFTNRLDKVYEIDLCLFKESIYQTVIFWFPKAA